MNTRRAGRPPGQQGAELLDTARKLFIENGFDGTSMNAIAAHAGVSKASLYREHSSKPELFVAVITDWTNRGRDSMRPHLAALAETTNAERALREFATILAAAILSPEVTAMRRLVATESRRFPDVASHYLDTSWHANIEELADTLATMTERRLIQAPDAHAAADQLVWLTVGRALNAATITGQQHEDDLNDCVQTAVRTFLARYGI